VRRLTATKPESLEFDRQGRGRPSAIRRVTLVCLIVVGGVWLYTFKAKMPDFEVYWRTGARAAHAEPLYRVTDGEYQFKYFPAHAVLAIPLGALPHPVARVVWFVVLLGALVAVLRLSVMTLPERRKPVGVLLAVLIVGLGKYYAIELAIGQINLLLVLIVISAMLALKAGREARAGWLVALAVMVKPYGLILVPWLIARGQTRSVVTVAAGMAVAFLLPATIYGLAGSVALHLDWWRTVSTTTAGVLTHPDNVSLAAMYMKWFGATATAYTFAVVTAVALLGLAVAVFLGRRGVPQPDGLEAGLLIALTPLLSPQGWDYILVVCTPAVVCLVNYIDRLPRALRPLSVIAIAAIGLTLFDLVGRTVYYALIRMSVVTLGVLVVIALLGVLRVRKVA
jgi:Glycosyltransferase family 87